MSALAVAALVLAAALFADARWVWRAFGAWAAAGACHLVAAALFLGPRDVRLIVLPSLVLTFCALGVGGALGRYATDEVAA